MVQDILSLSLIATVVTIIIILRWINFTKKRAKMFIILGISSRIIAGILTYVFVGILKLAEETNMTMNFVIQNYGFGTFWLVIIGYIAIAIFLLWPYLKYLDSPYTPSVFRILIIFIILLFTYLSFIDAINDIIETLKILF